jgi:hypothetical protein
MAPRKLKRPTKTVKIDQVAHPRLDELQVALGSQRLPRYVDQMEIVSALVMFTTPEQLAGMVGGYWQYIDKLLESEPAAKTDPAADVAT